MKLYFDKRLKDPTYYVQHGFRTSSGKATTKNIKILGKHSELLKITDDPITYCKEQIKLMNDEMRIGKASFQIDVDFNERVMPSDEEFSKSEQLNIGYFYLQHIYHKLKLASFFDQATTKRKIAFDCNEINRFLTYARILNPKSKYGTFDQLSSYFENPKLDYHQILRFMDILYDNYDAYLKWLYDKSNAVIKRDSSVIYYDCTNYYFETEHPDEEVADEVTGEILAYGLRKYGVSKEHRPNPIVEMGLLMDRRGIPISMCLHPGNTNEQITAVPLEKEIMDMMNDTDFIYCADAGLGSYNIRKFNAMGGRAFIVTQSIKKLSDVLKKAVFDDYDYKLLSTNKDCTIKNMKTFDRFEKENRFLYEDKAYKVIPADRAVDLGLYEYKICKNGKQQRVKSTGIIKQNIIITFSRKMMEYQRTIRNRQIERAKLIIKRNDPEEIKKGPNDVRRFMKRIASTKSGEDVSVHYEIDEAKIAEEEKYDGYYAVATNLLEDSAQEILAVMAKRYQIEDCFRILKTNFTARPVYHSNAYRIKAHFLICYTALLIYRLLECSLDDIGRHITTDNLIKTLQNMNVIDDGMYYRATYKGSKVLDALTHFENLALDRKRYQAKELKKKIKKNFSVSHHIQHFLGNTKMSGTQCFQWDSGILLFLKCQRWDFARKIDFTINYK